MPPKNKKNKGAASPKANKQKDVTDVAEEAAANLLGLAATEKDSRPEDASSPVANGSSNGATPVEKNEDIPFVAESIAQQDESTPNGAPTSNNDEEKLPIEETPDRAEDEVPCPVAQKDESIVSSSSGVAGATAGDASVKVSAPKKEFVFKIGKPTQEGEVIAHFNNGGFFRIVNREEKKWSFYNDSQNHEVHIKVTVGPKSKLERLGNTVEEDTEDGGKLYTLVVYPAQTEEMFKGDKDWFKFTINAIGLSLEYRAKLRAEADEKVQAEIRAIQDVTDTSDPSERLKTCIERGLKYVDLEFSPVQNSICRPVDMRQLPDCPWQRPEDYLPEDLKDKVCLFNKIEPDDIDQGALGDCWLLCAIAAVAEFPKRIEKLFIHPDGNDKLAEEIKAGAMRVTLNKNGWWTNYITDSYLPVMAGKPSFAKNVQDLTEQWASLLEKVYAKVSGSYACITGGDALQALPDFTGFPVNRFDTEWTDALASKEGSDKLFANLLKYDELEYLINLNTPGVDKTNYNSEEKKSNELPSGLDAKYAAAGLGMGHAYSCLTVKEFPEHNLKLLKIRNPWGGGEEWGGKWGDKDASWSKYPDVAKACNHTDADDGCFWMEWEDVKSYFCGGGVCLVKPSWYDYRVRGTFDFVSPDVVLEITVTKPTKMFCIFSQPDKRGQSKLTKKAKYAPAMLSIWRKNEEKEGQYKYHLNSTGDVDAPTEEYRFQKARDCSVLYEFTPEQGATLVVPRVMKVPKNFNKGYVLGLISEHPIDGKDIQVKFKSFPKNCKMFMNYPRFDYNPADESIPQVEAEYQHTPQNGSPQNFKGTELVA